VKLATFSEIFLSYKISNYQKLLKTFDISCINT